MPHKHLKCDHLTVSLSGHFDDYDNNDNEDNWLTKSNAKTEGVFRCDGYVMLETSIFDFEILALNLMMIITPMVGGQDLKYFGMIGPSRNARKHKLNNSIINNIKLYSNTTKTTLHAFFHCFVTFF